MHQPLVVENIQGVAELSPYPAHCRFCRKMSAFAVGTPSTRQTKEIVTIRCEACGRKWDIGKIVQAKVS